MRRQDKAAKSKFTKINTNFRKEDINIFYYINYYSTTHWCPHTFYLIKEQLEAGRSATATSLIFVAQTIIQQSRKARGNRDRKDNSHFSSSRQEKNLQKKQPAQSQLVIRMHKDKWNEIKMSLSIIKRAESVT